MTHEAYIAASRRNQRYNYLARQLKKGLRPTFRDGERTEYRERLKRNAAGDTLRARVNRALWQTSPSERKSLRAFASSDFAVSLGQLVEMRTYLEAHKA